MEGRGAYLGRSAICLGFETERIARFSDRTAEVSRGRSSHASDEGPNGPRKGLKEAASVRNSSFGLTQNDKRQKNQL